MTDWILPHKYSFEGQQISYDIQGHVSPLVLVHGTPWSSFNWRHIIPRLTETYTVYFYDLLGYGQSTKKDGQNVSLGIQNRVLASLLDHWQLNSPIIIGHDFGGTTVLRTHLIEKRDFAKIIVVDPVALSPWGSSFFIHVREHEAAFRGMPDYIHEAIVTAYVKGAVHHPMPEETLKGILKPWLGEVGKAAFYRQIAQANSRFTDEIEPKYQDLKCSVLIIWGEGDRWIPIETGERLHQAISGSKFKSISNAGHLVQEDNPANLLEAIIEFLSS
ncbi:Alpha/beta hydrolase [Hyella patelloides LEGE 07179]|uniref:Alpha/beta hydrolase n=1 Tax=Hyella patelloides LEGE 07179 TaxID=945734 RepID=A0A563VK33_9CYAN|nr:alpha/beta hydrolase [Hyella patelloides]VEP11799.1 Alpha/beta hydrolase [Hyella patelloides LEGE 07179]